MPTPENPIITEHHETPVISEQAQSLGVTTSPAQVTPVINDQGQPMISTPAPQSAKIQIPTDKTLLAQAKGKLVDAATWLANFLIRLSKIKNANTNTR